MNARKRLQTADETARLLEEAIKKLVEFSNHCRASEQKNNPQVILMRERADAKIDIMQDTLYALRGDFVNLKIIAERQ
jgi:hypothetical protein